MTILFVLAVAWLITVKAGANGARDYQLAKHGQLPPRAQQQIEAMKAAGQLSRDANIAPRDAFKAMRQTGGGAGRAYWQRCKDDAFDAMRERHELRDAKRRAKRQAKAAGTYRPGAFEEFVFDVKDGLWQRWDRAWDKATDRRRGSQRRQRQGTNPDVAPSAEPDRERHPDPLSNEPNPDSEPEVETSGSDRSDKDPDPAAHPADTGSETEQTSNGGQDADEGQVVDPEVEQAEPDPLPGPSREPDPEPAADADRDDAPSPITTPDAGGEPELASTPEFGTDADTTKETKETEETTEEPMADGMTQSTNSDTRSGGSVGEITSQRAMAACEEHIAMIALRLAGKAEQIAASAARYGMATDPIHQGIERLQNLDSRYATKARVHQEGAAAATELREAHQGYIADDLDYDVQDA